MAGNSRKLQEINTMDDAVYKAKYAELNLRFKALEDENDRMSLKVVATRANLKRLKFEKMFLMEKLDEVHRIAGTRNDNVLGSDTDLGSSDLESEHDASVDPDLLKKKPKRKRAEKDKNAPKKPVNAYVLFTHIERPKLKQSIPELPVSEISRTLGNMWKDLPEEDKKEFYERYEKDKVRYAAEMISYQGASAQAPPTGQSFMAASVPTVGGHPPILKTEISTHGNSDIDLDLTGPADDLEP